MKKSKLFLLIALLIFAGMISANPITPGNQINDSITNVVPCKASYSVDIKLNSNSDPSVPEIIDKAHRKICIFSGGNVTFHRKGKGNKKGFTIFAKDNSWSLNSTGNKLYYTAPIVEEEYEMVYGVTMPDADVDLDPIIIIIPSINR